jgi:hypothetical protein
MKTHWDPPWAGRWASCKDRSETELKLLRLTLAVVDTANSETTLRLPNANVRDEIHPTGSYDDVSCNLDV